MAKGRGTKIAIVGGIGLAIVATTIFWLGSAIGIAISPFFVGDKKPAEVVKDYKLPEGVSFANPFSLFSIKTANEKQEKLLKHAPFAASFILHVAVIFFAVFSSRRKQSLYGDAKFSSDSDIQKAGLFLNPPKKPIKQMSRQELIENGLFAGDRIVVGKKGGKFIAMGGQQFVYLAAPTRSGKGVGVVIPVGLSYAHSIVVSDIKQELYQLTAPFRAKCGHEIYLFDPFSVEGRTARWNPLTYVSRDPAKRVDDLNQIALSLIPDSGGNDPFWENSARNLFLGIGLWLLDREEWEKTSAVAYAQRLKKQWKDEQELVRRAQAHNIAVHAKFKELEGAQKADSKNDGEDKKTFGSRTASISRGGAKNQQVEELRKGGYTTVNILDEEAYNKQKEENKNRFGFGLGDEKRNAKIKECEEKGIAPPQYGKFIKSVVDGQDLPMFVKNCPQPEPFEAHKAPTIRDILDQCTDFKGDVQAHFHSMCSDVFTSDIARQTLNSSVSSAEQTFKSILSTLTSNLSPWLSEPVTNATSGDDFDLRDVRKKKMTIYFGIKPDDLGKAQKIINLFYSQLINENTRSLPEDDPSLKYQCLMLMDEGTAAGRIAVLEKAVSYMAGYNMRLLFIAQTPAQLEDKKVYGDTGARTILSNIALKILYKTTDVKDSEEYSKLLGKITVKEDTSSSRGGGNKGISHTKSTNQRDLMMPQEIREMDKSKEIITFTDIKYPIFCDKIIYYTDPAFMHLKGHGKAKYASLFERGVVKTAEQIKSEKYLDNLIERYWSDDFAHFRQELEDATEECRIANKNILDSEEAFEIEYEDE